MKWTYSFFVCKKHTNEKNFVKLQMLYDFNCVYQKQVQEKLKVII